MPAPTDSRSEPPWGSWNQCSRCCARTASATWAVPRTTSSARGATIAMRATRPMRACRRSCSISSVWSRMRSGRSVSSSGRWSNSRPTMVWPRQLPGWARPPRSIASSSCRRTRTWRNACVPMAGSSPSTDVPGASTTLAAVEAEVRRGARVDPRLPGAGRRRGRWFPGPGGLGGAVDRYRLAALPPPRRHPRFGVRVGCLGPRSGQPRAHPPRAP